MEMTTNTDFEVNRALGMAPQATMLHSMVMNIVYSKKAYSVAMHEHTTDQLKHMTRAITYILKNQFKRYKGVMAAGLRKQRDVILAMVRPEHLHNARKFYRDSERMIENMTRTKMAKNEDFMVDEMTWSFLCHFPQLRDVEIEPLAEELFLYECLSYESLMKAATKAFENR